MDFFHGIYKFTIFSPRPPRFGRMFVWFVFQPPNKANLRLMTWLVFTYQIKDRRGTTTPNTAVGSIHWLANQARIGIEHLFGTYAWEMMSFICFVHMVLMLYGRAGNIRCRNCSFLGFSDFHSFRHLFKNQPNLGKCSIHGCYGYFRCFPYHGQWLVTAQYFITICNSAHNPYQHLCFLMIHVPRIFHIWIQLYYVISYMFPSPAVAVGRFSRQSSQEWAWCYGSRCCIWKGILPSRERSHILLPRHFRRWFSFKGPIDLQAIFFVS